MREKEMAFGMYTFLWVFTTATLLVAEDSSRVTTDQGKISGFKEETTKGKEFFSFHSIPYAKPPIGNLRLKDPVASDGWMGVIDGSIVPPLCPQLLFIPATIRNNVYEGNEDCLYLSIFTTKPGKSYAELPVMVFFHGGAFFAGGIKRYTPYALMNENIVFVIIQYRLGILGFLSTEDDVIPGNFGVKDQVLALQWIQDHIHHFGGDKSRVTLFGESAGGASVHFHVISPRSEGLFARGIMQSGTLFCPWAMGGAYKEVSKYTGDLFNCPVWDPTLKEEQNSISLLTCLQQVDYVNLTLSLAHHIHWNFNPVLLGPRVDGDYIPEMPEILMKEGRYNKVDLISGINAHEGGLFVFPLYSTEALKSDLVNNFPEMGPASLDITLGDSSPVALATKLFEYYVGGIKANDEDADNLCRLYGDWQFNLGHDLVAKLFVKNSQENNKKKNIYLYELDHRGQRSFADAYDTHIGKTWVNHVDELYYLFTGIKDVFWYPLEKEEDLKLRDIILRLWYNFAAFGNPTPDGSLGFLWDAADEHHFHHLSLTPSPAMAGDQREKVRQFLTSLPTKQNYLLHPESVQHQLLEDVDHEDQQEDQPRVFTSPRKYYHTIKDEL